MTEKKTKSQETLTKLIELENKKPKLVEYVKGIIDGIILSTNEENDKQPK